MTKELESIINAAREDFENKRLVAFIGERHSGKTVISALLKHALVNHFVKNEENWNAWVIQGSDRINEILDKLNHEEFPASTLPGDAKPITMEIFSGMGTGGGIEITLQDMAGESRDELLRNEFTNEENRLKEIMTANPIEGRRYGILSYLPFTSIYVIIVDCSKYKNWNQEQSYLAATMNNLLKIKKAVGTDFKGKIMDPIAIIFSKYDQLSQEDQDTAENLLKKLPEFTTALNIAHRGELKLFLSQIKSVKRTEDELAILVSQEIQRKNTKLDNLNKIIKSLEMIIKDKDQELEEIVQELEEIEQKLEEAKPQNNPAEIEQITQELNEKKDLINQMESERIEIIKDIHNSKANKSEIEKKLNENKPSAKEIGISEFKPSSSPLEYNIEEYLGFISWIIEMSKE